MELKAAVILTVSVVLLATPVLSYGTGAPVKACGNMTPGHGAQSTAASPYSISVDKTKYNAGDSINVTVSGSAFKGMLMQVRKAGNPNNDTFGTWSNLPENTRIQNCTHADDSVTHANTNDKQNVTFTWTAPQGVTDDLQVIATVAQEKLVWWRELTSVKLTSTTSMSVRVGFSASPLFMGIILAVLAIQL